MISSMTAGSRPNRRPAINASELTIRCAADMRLFSAFTACPAPTSPACTTREPIAASNGRVEANACSAPPTMMVREPASAPATPPDTGASISVMPRLAARAASTRVRAGSDELMSMTMVSLLRLASSPSASSTCSTTSESGRLRMTAAAPWPTAVRELPCEISRPVPARERMIVGEASKPVTWYPAAASRLAIGMPMFPSPTNPTRPSVISWSAIGQPPVPRSVAGRWGAGGSTGGSTQAVRPGAGPRAGPWPAGECSRTPPARSPMASTTRLLIWSA